MECAPLVLPDVVGIEKGVQKEIAAATGSCKCIYVLLGVLGLCYGQQKLIW